jgi:hypothetical protein
MLAHLVYFETLASIEDTTTPAWKSVSAGLVVLRLVDAWLDSGPQVVTTDVTGLRAIRESIEAVSDGDPIRSILQSVVNTLQHAETASLTPIASPLLAYGRALHYAGQWKLAGDVFSSLVRRATAAGDTELAIHSSLRLGFVSRRLGDLEAADEAYESAGRLARRTRDAEGNLRAALGHAQNTIARGNLPQADEMLADVVQKAETAQLTAVLSDALHDRAHLCHLRKDFAAAVRLGYAALEFAGDALSRDRILEDVAAAFAELGHLSAARDAHLIVAATTQEDWLRHQTLINLMEIAIREGHEPSFHNYRRLLANAPLQPYMRAYYHLYAGQGYRTFGHPDNAAAEFQEAISVASAHNLNQLGFVAEAELERMETPAPPHVAPEWPNDLWEIASAISEMRELTTTATKSAGAA